MSPRRSGLGGPAHDGPAPTPMIFHPTDGIHLRARNIIEKCPHSPDGRWILPQNELLPEENPYVRFLHRQGNRCRMPALLHSKETLEFLGLDAVFAEKCWDRWTRLKENQRQTMLAPRTQVQTSYEQPKRVESSMPALLAHVQTQMLDLHMKEWDRVFSPEERARRLESNNSRNDLNRLPFGSEQMPNWQQMNNFVPGNLMAPQQNWTAITSGQNLTMAFNNIMTMPFRDNMTVPFSDNMVATSSNNMMAPFNNSMMANFPDGAFPILQDQTFGPSNQPTGGSVPVAANAGPSTLQRSPGSSSGHSHRSNSSSSSVEVTAGIDTGHNGPLDRFPLLGPQFNTTDSARVNRTFEAQVSRFFGLGPEAAWQAYHVMTNVDLQKYVGVDGEMLVMDFDVFTAILNATLTVDALMTVVIVPRFKLLLQMKRMSEFRAEKWPRMAVTTSIEAVQRCVDPVVPASQSGSAPQDPMADVERVLQGCIDGLRRQGVNANDCPRFMDIRPEWLAPPIEQYMNKRNGVQSTGNDGKNRTKAECEWDFLKKVRWENMPMGNLWDVAHAPYNPSPRLSS